MSRTTADPQADSSAGGRAPRPRLSLFDATCIMVGIIVGASIYQASPTIAGGASASAIRAVDVAAAWVQAAPLSESGRAAVGTAATLGVWVIGGLIALAGAVCYAELSVAYPREGGNYSYLCEAYGRDVGFAFAWAEFWIVRPGNVGAIAFVFAKYAAQLAGLVLPAAGGALSQMVLACGAVLVLTGIHLLGLRASAASQNALTVAKALGLAAIVAVALSLLGTRPQEPVPASASGAGLGLALVLVMFAYGGWSDMSYVAADVENPQRNMLRSLLLGAGLVTAIYVAVTAAFIASLSLGGLIRSQAVATDVMSQRLGSFGAAAISLLICISTLGAIHGTLFAGGRVFYALGREDSIFGWLGAWSQQRTVPVRALLAQAATTLGLIVVFGRDAESFERLVAFTGPFFWSFLLLIGIGFFLLRRRGAIGQAGYRVPLFPLPPLALCAACLFMVYSAVMYAWTKRGMEAFWALAVVAGAVAALVARRLTRKASSLPR
jgi:amino acid transporter